MKFAAPPILRRFGFRSVLVVQCADLRRLSRRSRRCSRRTRRIVFILLGCSTGGFFRSLQFTSLNALAYRRCAAANILSQATSISAVAQQLSSRPAWRWRRFLLESARSLRGDTAS